VTRPPAPTSPVTLLAELTSLVEREAARVEGLADVLDRQRAAVARSDAPGVEATVGEISRALETLEATRQRLRSLLRLLPGDGSSLDALEVALGHPLPPTLAAARERLRAASARVLREAAVNQATLRRAADSAEHWLQDLFASAGLAAPTYGAGERGPEASTGAGLLLDRRG
jgi:hypothetical protein